MIDESEDHNFVFDYDFTIFRFIKNDNVIDMMMMMMMMNNNNNNPSRFKFRTDDNFLYNKKNNIPVCVISLSSVIKKENIHYPIFKLQKCFNENF